jgi:hypothetical protein
MESAALLVLIALFIGGVMLMRWAFRLNDMADAQIKIAKELEELNRNLKNK